MTEGPTAPNTGCQRSEQRGVGRYGGGVGIVQTVRRMLLEECVAVATEPMERDWSPEFVASTPAGTASR